jgi:hypothetical protein
MFVQCEDVSLRSSKDSSDRFPAPIIKWMCLCGQNVQLFTIFVGRTDPHFGAVLAINRGQMALPIMHHFLRSHRSSFWYRLVINRGQMALQILCAVRRCVIEVIKGQRWPFSCLQHKMHVSLCSKLSIMHHFSRSHGSSFWYRLVLNRGQMALQICLCSAKMVHWGH